MGSLKRLRTRLARRRRRAGIASETPKIANLVKLSGNFLLAAVIKSLGEAMALVGKAGLDRRQYLKGWRLAPDQSRVGVGICPRDCQGSFPRSWDKPLDVVPRWARRTAPGEYQPSYPRC